MSSSNQTTPTTGRQFWIEPRFNRLEWYLLLAIQIATATGAAVAFGVCR